ncbi:MAG: hypothetical protein ACE5GE_17535, partial [Phycisphaerae bacterium]
DIKAEFAGQILPMTDNSPSITGNGKRLKLFYDPPLPPSARVRVTIVGDNILDDLGNQLDADGNGTPGGTRTVDFDTCTVSRIPNTNVEGYVIASERAPGCADPKDPACDLPLEGVTLWVDGFPKDDACDGVPPEELCAVTDSDGHFVLVSTPVPGFLVEIDGTSITAVGGQPPPGDCSYPRGEMQMFHSTAGYTVQVATNGVPHNIHIPCIANDSPVPIKPGQPTNVGLSPTGQQAFADMFPGSDPTAFSINIPADSLTMDDGTPGTQVSVYPVDVDRLPVPLLEGLDASLMMEIVTDGAVNLDDPAPVCFPNVPDPATGNPLPPGAKSAILSFNHDTGQWESGGSMTVTEDGQAVCSDEGTGFTEFCYHAQAPGSNASGGPFSTTCVVAVGTCAVGFAATAVCVAACSLVPKLCLAGPGDICISIGTGAVGACAAATPVCLFTSSPASDMAGEGNSTPEQQALELALSAMPIIQGMLDVLVNARAAGVITDQDSAQLSALLTDLDELVPKQAYNNGRFRNGAGR